MIRRVVGLLALVVLTAACQSTARTSLEARRGAGDAASVTGAEGFAHGGDGAGDATGGESTGGVTGQTSAGGSATSGAGATSGSTGGSTGGGGATAPAAASAPVEIGIRYLTGVEQLANLVGAKGFSVPDTRAMAQALVDELNRTGGLAGHRIVPVFHPYDASDPAGTSTQEQTACSFFVEDHHVPVVVAGFFSSDVLQTCLAKRNVVLVDENYGFFDTSRAPDTYFVPGFPDAVRSAGPLVDALVARGFFGAKPKIGITMKDSPDRNRTANGLKAALRKHGLVVSDEIRYTTEHPEALSSGILRFRSNGVSHVFVLDIGGLESGVMMQQAESQGYRPRYAIDTRNVPIYIAANAPAAQLHGAAGIGWAPSSDVGRGPGSEPGAEERRCVSIMRNAGIQLQDAGNDKLAYAYCDVLFLLKAAADRAGGLASVAVKRGVESLGDSFHPVGGFAARFRPGRHDGASGARAFSFDDNCGCFKYSGGLLDLG